MVRSSQGLLAQRAIYVLFERVCPSRMEATNDDCHIRDDMDTLTVMNEDVVMASSDDARNVSQSPLRLQQRANLWKHFWHLRYQVQEIGPQFHEQSQMAISTRLTALRGIDRFDARAILHTKVRQVVKELMKRVSELKQDKHRLRVRSRRLMRRVSGNISAHRCWQDRLRRELDAIYDGYYLMEDRSAVDSHLTSR